MSTRVIAGMFFVMFGMITAVGLSSLKYVDLDSSRNLLIIGLSLFLGLAIPGWIKIQQANGVDFNLTGSSYAILATFVDKLVKLY